MRPSRIEQTGTLPAGVQDTLTLANEPEGGGCGLAFEFDLESVAQKDTPLARLDLGQLEKQKVSRPGQTPPAYRGALHVFSGSELVGSSCVKPAGIPTPYMLDVTGVVDAVLARPPGQRKLRLEVKMLGLPAFFEVYRLLPGAGKQPALEIASEVNWTRDWAQRLAPIAHGPFVYREACLPIVANRDKELILPLLFPAAEIIEVVANGTGTRLEEGRDWRLVNGELVLAPNTRAPVQTESEFFTVERKSKTGEVTSHKTTIRLVEGTWYHERQLEVSYKPAARNWRLPPPISSLKQLPRLERRLKAKAPVRVVLFGDSIATGGNASKFQGAWPYQPAFGELVQWELERHYKTRVTLMNHSRGGGTSAFATTQVESQVAWFKPDLAIIAFGMNDRSDERRKHYRENLEKIIDLTRAMSPETEFILVTSMLNNPKQPTGLSPVLFLRDEALAIRRPGLAVVDMTGTHQALVERKPYLDTSGNGVNHPNDFLHRIYAQRILEVLIPERTGADAR